MSERISNRKERFSNLSGIITKTQEKSQICHEWSQIVRKCLKVISGRLSNISGRTERVSHLRTFLSQTERERSKYLWNGLKLVRKDFK